MFDLVELAAVEVSRATGSARLLDAAALERDLRAGAEQAAATLATAGARLLVLDAGGAAASRGELRRHLAAARCDAVLVAAP